MDNKNKTLISLQYSTYVVNVVHAYDQYDFAYDGTFALLHTHHKHIMYSKHPATSTDAHQEKLDLVKHSDDAHEAPPLGCRLDEGFGGHGWKACGAGCCGFSIKI